MSQNEEICPFLNRCSFLGKRLDASGLGSTNLEICRLNFLRSDFEHHLFAQKQRDIDSFWQ
eukprot:UN21452